ncbi:MAG: sugar phosphate nucleotidyltransferase [Aestuariivirgaceae bacterium]
MKVIILGAGQGKRLLPLTADVPKALLDIGGRTLVGRQIDAFADCGITEFVVITGYGAAEMDEELGRIAVERNLTIRSVFNPFYCVADNLASCWMARHEMHDPFIQVNGDNVFKAALVEALLANPDGEVSVAINHKDQYDADDMKVMLDGNRLTEIGKKLPIEAVDAEAIGFYVFQGAGCEHYRSVLDQMMQQRAGLNEWFPAAVGQLAKMTEVGICDVSGHSWCEVDFPTDLQHARHLVANW